MSSNLDPVSAFVRSLDGEYYLVREAAEAMGVSQHYLRRSIKQEVEGMLPSHGVMIGKMKVYLYTMDDIHRMRKLIAERKKVSDFETIKDSEGGRGGRPTVYTKEERVERARLYSRACYWKNRVKHADAINNDAMKKRAEKELGKLEKEILSGVKGR